MERCPVCRARLPEEGTVCRRCNVDLALSLKAIKQSEVLTGEAIYQLSQGNPASALTLARRACLHRETTFAVALKGFLERISNSEGASFSLPW